MIKRRKINIKITLFIAIAILLSICSFLLFQNKSFKYCNNEKELLGINDSIKEIYLNLKQTNKKIKEEIESQYDYDISDKLLNCTIKLSNGELIGLKYLKPKYISNCWFSTTSIYINQDNQLLFEEELTESNELKNKIYNLLLKQDYYDKFKIEIGWEKSTSLRTIEETLIQIKQAYSLYYKTKAKEKFNKNICELNNEEFEEINKVNYDLYLTNILVDIVPPPPIPKY